MAPLSDRFLCVCRRALTDVPPVWFRWQSGRCLPEYRALRLAGMPARYCSVDTAGLLGASKEAGRNSSGLNWRVGLDEAAWYAPVVLGQAVGPPGHSFNLGHGVLSDAPLDTIAQPSGCVHQERWFACA